ncbi:ATP-dependent dethiobiotin synthetase BioD [Streptomyces sp. OF3]|uniref:ATP-dependent dethiobiotin synthetase BioD n=1 Tax=Streptomyces alkaliterrae TaxID=2213162 RepID=A0A7W3WIK0_9ACTN|nr:dethiobiotin synthase [Streptomyces alkaliterrae]MBB1252974.1 ATP-dependent dethiobiotin synthetase BioD [Streptomyces alkaliterrae]
MGEILVVSGTGTEVGKTVVTAAVAACALRAGRTVAVLKPAQTGVAEGEAGDVAEVGRLVGGAVTGRELGRYPEPLAPATAAARAGLPPVSAARAAAAARELAAGHDLVLVEGAGGLLVRLDEQASTLADVAGLLDAPVLLAVAAGLGTLNTTALTAEALASRGLACRGLVVGSWPSEPGLAERCNLDDLPVVAGAPLLGVVPGGAGGFQASRFTASAPAWLAPELGGTWDRRPGG